MAWILLSDFKKGGKINIYDVNELTCDIIGIGYYLYMITVPC